MWLDVILIIMVAMPITNLEQSFIYIYKIILWPRAQAETLLTPQPADTNRVNVNTCQNMAILICIQKEHYSRAFRLITCYDVPNVRQKDVIRYSRHWWGFEVCYKKHFRAIFVNKIGKCPAVSTKQSQTAGCSVQDVVTLWAKMCMCTDFTL